MSASPSSQTKKTLKAKLSSIHQFLTKKQINQIKSSRHVAPINYYSLLLAKYQALYNVPLSQNTATYRTSVLYSTVLALGHSMCVEDAIQFL